MTLSSIDVTQQVHAPYWRRLLAFALIDCLLIVLTLVLVGRFAVSLAASQLETPSVVWSYRSEQPAELLVNVTCRPNLITPVCFYYESEQDLATAHRQIRGFTGIALLVSLVLWVAYLAVGNALGTSLGKALFGLRVVSLRQSRPRAWLQGLLRTLGYLVSALPLGLGFLAALWHPQRRAWHDRIAATTVVRRERSEGAPRAHIFATVVSLLAIAIAGPAAGAVLFLPSTAPATQAQDADRPAVFDDILVGYKAINERYVDLIDEPALLTSAWVGAVAEARQAGVVLPADPRQIIQTQSELQQQLVILRDAAKGKLTESELALASIDAMAASLNDDHTYFVTPDRARLLAKNQSSTLGVQVVTSRDPSGLLIWGVDAGGVGERAGLKPGDVLIRIDGEAARSTSIEPGKPVAVTLVRAGAGELTLQATGEARPELRIESRMLENGVGYVRLSSFSTSTDSVFTERLDAELKHLIEQGAQSWVLDLRNNAGGLARNAAVVAGRLGLDGPLLTNHLRGGRQEIVKPLGPAAFKGAPGVILINERTASSSEIVAGAMHDGAVAYLIGAKSSGRVNLSRSFPVGGGLLYVTIGRTGIGNPERSLTGIGIQPDEVVAHSVQALSANRDLQLERAVAYLRNALNAANAPR